MFNVYVGKSVGGEEGKERKRKSMLQVGGGGKAKGWKGKVCC